MELHERIRELREKKGMTQQELAELLGYKDRSTINKVEKGVNAVPTWAIGAYARALDVTIPELLGCEEAEKYNKEPDPLGSALVSLLTGLKPAEIEKVSIFIDGLKAARE